MGALHHVLTGLMALHKLGYVHRDIKPSNILHARGVWCISDYGGVAAHDLTSTVKGTRTYWAPEVAQGDPSTGKFLFNQKTDIYAFGCIMLQLLRSDGRLPWQDLADNHAQAYKQERVMEFLLSNEGWLPGVTEQHRAILQKCLAPDSSQRYSSVDDIVEYLLIKEQDKKLPIVKEVTSNSEQPPKAPAVVHTSSLMSKLREHITGRVVIPAGVYDIDFKIWVEPSGSLEIRQGAVFRFGKKGGIVCEGEFKAMGTEHKRVQFLPKEPQSSWGGISLYETCELGQLEFCDIQGKTLLIVLDEIVNSVTAFDSQATSLLLREVTFSECYYGALLISGGREVRLSNCEFVKSGYGEFDRLGGSFYVNEPLERLVLEGCVFHGNYGKIYLGANRVEINSCEFLNNQSQFEFCEISGSNIYSEVLIADSKFTRNTGSHGVSLFNVARFEIADCLFIKNKAKGAGGGINASTSSRMSGRVVSCVFEDNIGLVGAGFYISNGKILFKNTKFRHNLAQYHGGAVIMDNCRAEFERCTFHDNSAGEVGGAIAYYRGTLVLGGCHFRGNSPHDVYDADRKKPVDVRELTK
ncbi:hypothetical protein DRJ48_05115 [Candidatus Woesearchaeota archaeon]|nr:MAG: hypothetical protein DRJ48_05115 [Candidatus Woesearchaeota archaeon]